MPVKYNTAGARCFEQRGLFQFLLAAPDRLGAETNDCQNNAMLRLATQLSDGNAPSFPANELKAVLSTLKDECRCDNDLPDDSRFGRSIVRPPRKRARRSPNINLHSTLRFVERVIYHRYLHEAKGRNADNDFLEEEMKIYFGKNYIAFQTEEEILCLAFEMALNAIKQTCINIDTNIHHGNHHSSLCDGVVKTGLQIIDSAVLIDIRERATLCKLQQAKERTQISTNAKASNRRKKYEHLLQPGTKVSGEKGQTHSANKNPGDSSEAKSIMEEKYPEEWEWLQQFRKKYEAKQTELDITHELQQSHYQTNVTGEKNQDRDSQTVSEEIEDVKPIMSSQEGNKPRSYFEIIRRKIKTLDDLSLSSDDTNEEKESESGMPDAEKEEQNSSVADLSDKSDIGESKFDKESSLTVSKTASASSPPPSTLAKPVSPYDKLDKETYEVRLALNDMPLSESSSAEVVRHTVDEIGTLLNKYGELDGATGINRCGDILCGNRTIDTNGAKEEAETESAASGQFPLNDAMVSALIKAFLTDATGALRAKSFLRSFVLPLMLNMNPVVGSNVQGQKNAKDKGKPASRALTSLLASLAHERPTECVVSVIVPSLVLRKHNPLITPASEALFEPTRFQCELISRVLRGKDALSSSAIALLVEEVLPAEDETTAGVITLPGMKWTDNTMPVLTACLNRQPSLPDEVVAKLADEVTNQLSPKTTQMMGKSMKCSTLFHALITKYGSQLKSTGKVESLKDSSTRLKTFMSKTIGLSLKKLS